MRYQDWDILLFPSGDHVPVQEFKTACYAVREPGNSGGNANGGDLMPLLTSFVPTMAAGTPFTVSVHSWSQQSPVAGSEIDLSALDLQWEVRVVVDGLPVCTEHLPAATTWPKVISRMQSPFFPTNERYKFLTSTAAATEDTAAAGEIRADLRFPPFDSAMLSQHHWSPDDRAGRIRVEIFGGYSRGINVGEETAFVRLVNVAAFAFQPAPIELLEHNRISWPNPHMFANPLKSSLSQGPTPPQSAGLANGVQKKVMHDRKSSFSSMAFSSPMGAMPGAPPPTPTDSLDPRGGMRALPDFANRYGGRDVSGSTSSSSSYPTIAFDGNGSRGARTYPTALATGPPQQPLEFRLPSDQIRQIIDGLGARGLNSLTEIQRMVPLPNNNLDDTSRMPPPPTPMGKKGTSSFQTYGLGQDQFGPLLGSFGDSINSNNSRRGISRSSDVSMHAGCANYPHCIHEDEDGRLWHDVPAAPVTPATVVRGKKEGISLVTSSSGTASVDVGKVTAPRDFLSKVLADSNTNSTATASANTPAQVAGMLSSSPVLNDGHDNEKGTLLSSSSPAISHASNGTNNAKGGVENTPAASSATKKRTRSTRRSTNGAESEELSSAVKPRRKSSRKTSAAVEKKETVGKDAEMGGMDGVPAAAAAAAGDEEAIVVAAGGKESSAAGQENLAVAGKGTAPTSLRGGMGRSMWTRKSQDSAVAGFGEGFGGVMSGVAVAKGHGTADEA